MPRSTVRRKRKRSFTAPSRRTRGRRYLVRVKRRRVKTRRKRPPRRKHTFARATGSSLRTRFPLVPFPRQKAITLVWRQQIAVPICTNADRVNKSTIVLKMNDPGDPIFRTPYVSAWPDSTNYTETMGVAHNNWNANIKPKQPLYHDLLRDMYKGLHVARSTTTVRALPQRTKPMPAYVSEEGDPLPGPLSQGQATPTPFRLVVTQDEDAYEGLLHSFEDYKDRAYEARISGLKTQRTTYYSRAYTGEPTQYCKPLTQEYDCRKFWDLNKYVPLYHTKFHRQGGSLRGLIADQSESTASAAVNVSTATHSVDVVGQSSKEYTQSLMRHKDMMRFTKPWNSYENENVNPLTGTPKVMAPAYLRIQALGNGIGDVFPTNKDQWVLLEVVTRYRCIFFDQTEQVDPVHTPDNFGADLAEVDEEVESNLNTNV